MKKTTYFFAMIAMCGNLSLMSCGSDDDDSVYVNNGTGQTNNNTEQTDNGTGQNNNGTEQTTPDSSTGNDECINVRRAQANEEGNFIGGGLIFCITSFTDNTVEVIKTSQEVNKETFTGGFLVPAYIECEEKKYKVTSLGETVFKNDSKMTAVSLPSTLLTIGDYAFYNCSGLTSVVIPNSVTAIGSGAFAGCIYEA